MERVVAALCEALRRAGASEEYAGKVLGDLGLDAPREANSKRRPVAKTVQSENEVTAARPGIYRVASNGVKRLHLKKTSPTTGSWFVRWRTPKDELAAALKAGKQMRKRPEIGLGSIKDVPLAKAIQLAGQINAGLDQEVSVNPRDVRATQFAEIARKAEADKAEAALPTVAEMAEHYVAWMASEKNERAWRGRSAVKNFINPLKAHVFPAIGAMKVNEVTPQDVALVLAAIRSKGLVDERVRSSLRSLFTWLIESGIRDSKLGNPVSMISASKRKAEHYDRVEPAKAPGVFQELLALAAGSGPMPDGARPGDRTPIACWAFMALTAARPSEAITARWDQIDRDAKVWRNPVSKTGKMLEVPLTDTALAILTEMEARRARGVDLVFAGKGGVKMGHSNFAGAPQRAGIDAKTPHGWRSVASDALSEHCHISREVREAVLGHALPATEGAYRRGDALAARAVAMQRYEQWLLSGQEQGGSVVEFRRASA
jgi:integrase